MARKRDLEASANPPIVPPVNADTIPQELRDCAQWVLWKWESRTDGRGRRKWTKVPIQSLTRAAASSTDPETWATFAEVFSVYSRPKIGIPGIGFTFHADDPFCGVDLDDCRDSETGEIATWAMGIITRLASYAEVSPSMTGVKIFLKADLVGGRRRVPYEGGEVEVYDCGRYFTVTGLHVEGTPATVEDAQEALDAIYAEVFAVADAEAPPAVPTVAPPLPANLSDAALIDRMFSSLRGDSLNRLWYGETDGHEGDHSRADLALCIHLAWWCQGDLAQVDRLFRQSGLMRPKWDQGRGVGTYGQRTLEKAGRVVGGAVYNPAHRRVPVVAANPTPTVAVAPLTVPVAAPEPTSPPPEPSATSAAVPAAPHRLSNYIMIPTLVNEGHTVFAPRGLSAPEIAAPFFRATDNWPRRVGDHLFVPHPTQHFRWLTSNNSLFAWASATLDPNGMGNPIQWGGRGDDMLTKGEFFDHLTSHAQCYEGVEVYPHEPPRPSMYYCDFPAAGGDGHALDDFLDFFSPASDLDRELLLSVLLTACWGGDTGQRPMFAFIAADGDLYRGRGTGKTTTAQQIAEIWDGFVKVRINDDFTEVQKRLLSPAAAMKRFILIDNVRESKLSVADLEDLITSNWISGRQMYEGEGRRPNLFTVMLTYNDMQMSLDLAQRSIIVQLARPRVVGNWSRRLNAFIRDRRAAIIGDLAARLRQPRTPLTESPRRWGQWEDEVLSRVGSPNECQQLIYARQGTSDGDNEQMELVREAFHMVLRRNAYDPSRTVVFFTTNQAVDIASMAKLGRFATCDNPQRLARMGVPELRKHRRNQCRGFLWVGTDTVWDSLGKLSVFDPSHKLDMALATPDGMRVSDDGDGLPD